MQRIYSNGNDCDQVRVPFLELLKNSKRADLAAPYFTCAKLLLKTARKGAKIRLLVDLNMITCPDALGEIIKAPNPKIEIKYLVRKFHAKIYIFDKDKFALLGSANLTPNGLTGNREAVIRLCQDRDSDDIQELRKLFDQLWEDGDDFDEERLVEYRKEHDRLRKLREDSRKATANFESLFAPKPFGLEKTEFGKACTTVFGAIVHRNISVQKRSLDPDILHVNGLELCFRTINPRTEPPANRSDICYKISFLPQLWAYAMNKDEKNWAGCRYSGKFKQPLIVDLCFNVDKDELTLFGQLYILPGSDKNKKIIIECIEEAAERHQLQDRIGVHARYGETKPQSTFFKDHKCKLGGKHDAKSLAKAMNKLMTKFAPAIEAIGEALVELDFSS